MLTIDTSTSSCSKSFSDVFNSYLIVELAELISFEECLLLMSLNRGFHYLIQNKVDLIWKKYFLQEFLHESYVD